MHDYANRAQPQRIWLKFAALALIWGSSFMFIKVALEGFSPAQIVAIRLCIASALLACIMLTRRHRWPRRWRTWLGIGVNSLFYLALPFLLYAWAGQFVPSSVSSLYNATMPILTMLASLAILPTERLTRNRSFALFTAFLGVILLAAPWTLLATVDSTEGPIALAHLACLGANVSYGIGYALSRKLLRDLPDDPLAITAAQIFMGALITLASMPFVGGFAPISPSLRSVACVLALGLLSSGVCYIWISQVQLAWGATGAASVTYLTPVVGVAVGVLLLGEPLHWNEPVGGLVILASVLLSQGGDALRRLLPGSRAIR